MKKIIFVSLLLATLSACASKLIIVKDCLDTVDANLKVCKPL